MEFWEIDPILKAYKRKTQKEWAIVRRLSFMSVAPFSSEVKEEKLFDLPFEDEVLIGERKPSSVARKEVLRKKADSEWLKQVLKNK